MYGSIFDGLLRDDHCRYEDRDGDAVIEVELPGVPRASCALAVSDGILTLAYAGRGGDRQMRWDVRGFDHEGATASLRDGLLTVRVPRLGGSKTRRIEIG